MLQFSPDIIAILAVHEDVPAHVNEVQSAQGQRRAAVDLHF